MELLSGGLAGAMATIFSNPMDVIKIRLQLQGELKAKGAKTQLYRGALHGLYVVAKNDGLRALQKGLLAGMIFSFNMNAVRLGLYRIAERDGYTKNSAGEFSFLRAAPIAIACSFMSGVCANPASVVKTRLQSGSHESIAVGHQHAYTGTWDAVRSIYKQEGIGGFFTGVNATCSRLAVGGGTQLVAFTFVKSAFLSRGLLTDSPILLSFVASVVGGGVVSVTMCPLDVISTRLYNQASVGKDRLYDGMLDCLMKTYKAEGVYGLYKGLGPLYIRLAPHTTLSLVIWDRLNSLIKN